MLNYVPAFYPFLGVNTMPLYVRCTFCLSIRPLADICVISSIWLLRIMLLWIPKSPSTIRVPAFSSLGDLLRRGIVGLHSISVNFQSSFQPLSHGCGTIQISITKAQRLQPLHFFVYICFPFCSELPFLWWEVKSYCGFDMISLTANNNDIVKYGFLSICLYPVEKYLTVLCPFLNWVVCLLSLLSCKCSLYILDINH
jgi:hypothetical protein